MISKCSEHKISSQHKIINEEDMIDDSIGKQELDRKDEKGAQLLHFIRNNCL